MPSVEFRFPFVGGKIYLFGVDYDHVVPAVAVGAIGRFVLAFEEGGDRVGETADGLGRGVD